MERRARIRMKVPRVPRLVRAGDYHDFEYLQEDYREIVPGIKVKELGFDPTTGAYIGLVYMGNLKEPKNRKVWQPEVRRLKKIEREFDWNAAVPIRP